MTDPVHHGHAGHHGHAPTDHAATTTPAEGLEAKVLTVSDGVASGNRDDRSGRALVERLGAEGFVVVEHLVVADGRDTVGEAIVEMAEGFVGVIVTTGGTGFGPRDLTPEGTSVVLDRQAPGLAEAMRLVNPLGRLSRGVAGTRGSALVLNAPGSTAGAVECLEAVIDVVPHAVRLLAGDPR
jgi:molybdopterin adenylyltransferase